MQTHAELRTTVTRLKYYKGKAPDPYVMHGQEWRALSWVIGDEGADALIKWCAVQDDPFLSMQGLVSIAALTDTKDDLITYVKGRVGEDLAACAPYPSHLRARAILRRTRAPGRVAVNGWRPLQRLIGLEDMGLVRLHRKLETRGETYLVGADSLVGALPFAFGSLR